MDEQGLPPKAVRALVVGLAREGTTAAEYLARRGVRVTVTDARPAAALEASLAALAAWPVQLALGGHPSALLDEADVVVVSPGVPLDIPLLAEARRRGLPLSSETRLFTRLCPAPIAGLTGSSGKTTTTAVVGEMLMSAGRRTWVGGNIGRPLLGLLDQIQATDWVVMELSSFQLELFGPSPAQGSELFDPAGWSPPVAAILNITPNHLDRHPSMEAYAAAKANILAFQRPQDVAVLNWDDPLTRRLGRERGPRQRTVWFSLEHEPGEGAFLRGDELLLRLGGREEPICRRAELKLLGRHNVANVLAASAVAGVTGAPVEALRRVATTFRGVEHRLELVRERGGVCWYNDSIATTPERTVAALLAFDVPVVLLAGGRDKHLPWQEMAALTWTRVRHLILFGEAAGLIDRAMRESPAVGSGACQIHPAGSLERAVELAAGLSRPGDVVLLSPGGTSFDVYADFSRRGEHFRRLVMGLE